MSWAQMGHENKGLSHGREHCLPRGSLGALSSQRTPPGELSLVTTHRARQGPVTSFLLLHMSANESRCKQDLFHINILTGFVLLVK